MKAGEVEPLAWDATRRSPSCGQEVAAGPGQANMPCTGKGSGLPAKSGTGPRANERARR